MYPPWFELPVMLGLLQGVVSSVFLGMDTLTALYGLAFDATRSTDMFLPDTAQTDYTIDTYCRLFFFRSWTLLMSPCASWCLRGLNCRLCLGIVVVLFPLRLIQCSAS